jgi:3D (Asp-Asp-Asp) domain-containing protein
MTRRIAMKLTAFCLLAMLMAAPAQSRMLSIYHLPVETRDQLLAAVPRAKAVFMEVTAYCPCRKCCGPEARGITASGRDVSHIEGRFVAADTALLPFHTKLVIPGYAANMPVEVLDKGGAIKGNRLDVFFPTHEQALQWGRRLVEVIVVE